MISFKTKGDFSKLNNWFEKTKEIVNLGKLNEYGRRGVEALENATPIDSGDTAHSWFYRINREKNSVSISFHNSNINEGVPIAIILQYGHGTKNGGWVEGIDYINPAIQPIFNEIVNDAWKEVSK